LICQYAAAKINLPRCRRFTYLPQSGCSAMVKVTNCVTAPMAVSSGFRTPDAAQL
jgi:hypothetical protein